MDILKYSRTTFTQFIHLTLITTTLLLSSHVAYGDAVQIQHPRINPTVEGISVTAVYFDIVNTGNETKKLVNVTGDISNRIEIHQHKMNNGLMRMQKVDGGISLPAQETVIFKPGSYHLMVMNLQRVIHENDMIDFTLHFDNGSHKIISARAIKASATQHSHHSGH